MAWFASPLRFAFAADGTLTDGTGDMVVTYLGAISQTKAQDDAKRRFKQWQSLHNPLSRRRSADQVVVL